LSSSEYDAIYLFKRLLPNKALRVLGPDAFFYFFSTNTDVLEDQFGQTLDTASLKDLTNRGGLGSGSPQRKKALQPESGRRSSAARGTAGGDFYDEFSVDLDYQGLKDQLSDHFQFSTQYESNNRENTHDKMYPNNPRVDTLSSLEQEDPYKKYNTGTEPRGGFDLWTQAGDYASKENKIKFNSNTASEKVSQYGSNPFSSVGDNKKHIELPSTNSGSLMSGVTPMRHSKEPRVSQKASITNFEIGLIESPEVKKIREEMEERGSALSRRDKSLSSLKPNLADISLQELRVRPFTNEAGDFVSFHEDPFHVSTPSFSQKKIKQRLASSDELQEKYNDVQYLQSPAPQFSSNLLSRHQISDSLKIEKRPEKELLWTSPARDTETLSEESVDDSLSDNSLRKHMPKNKVSHNQHKFKIHKHDHDHPLSVSRIMSESSLIKLDSRAQEKKPEESRWQDSNRGEKQGEQKAQGMKSSKTTEKSSRENLYITLSRDLLVLETKVERLKIDLGRSVDFNVSVLFDWLDQTSNGYITSQHFNQFLESLPIPIKTDTDLIHVNKLIGNRKRLNFGSFSRFFYPVSPGQFELMRSKMYSYSSHASLDFALPTMDRLRQLFVHLLEVEQVKRSAAQALRAAPAEFPAFLRLLCAASNDYFDFPEFERCPVVQPFSDEVKKKVFDGFDSNYLGRVFKQDVENFLCVSAHN
jgi:hypothetical protein